MNTNTPRTPMRIYPAIDLYEGMAVRLLHGDYENMTVFSRNPVETAKRFREAGAAQLHMVDLEGAKRGDMPNLATVAAVVRETGLFVELGGGIRDRAAVERCLDAGVGRVILGTTAVTDEPLLRRLVEEFGDRVAVGADVRGGYLAIRGWTETSAVTLDGFLSRMEQIGVRTAVCTDISKDGAMRGANRALYRRLVETTSLEIIASGGVSTTADLTALAEIGVAGAIVGRACYTGAVDLAAAIRAVEEISS